MTNEEFLLEIEEAFLRSKKLLNVKRHEYSGEDGDRLDQFHRAGVAQDIKSTVALCGMMTKHFTSIADMCKEPLSHDLYKWQEKITDLRNYTFLLEALIKDLGVE